MRVFGYCFEKDIFKNSINEHYLKNIYSKLYINYITKLY